MPALSDFDRRDAERRARYEIADRVQSYVIRMTDFVKTDVKEQQDEAARLGRSFDPVAAGRAAAEAAFAKYGFGTPIEPVEGKAVAAVDASERTRSRWPLGRGSDPADGFA